MEPWLLILIAFVGTFALVLIVDAFVVVPRQRAKLIRRRLVQDIESSLVGQAQPLLWRRPDDAFLMVSAGALNRFIRQAGIRPDDPRTRQIAGICAPLSLAVLTALAVTDIRWALIALAVTAALGILGLRQLRRRRLDRFGRMLPDAIDIIVRDLRAGLPLTKALLSVGSIFHGVVGAEFQLVANEVAYGADVAEAFGRLSARVGHPELDLLLAALRIGFETGGDLTPILTKLSATIRKRIHMQQKLYALSAEMRLTAHILSALPLCVFVLINLLSPNYYGGVWHLDIVWKVLAGCVLGLGAGNIFVRRMIDQQF